MRPLFLLLLLLALHNCSLKAAVEETTPFLLQLNKPALVDFYLEQQNKGLTGKDLKKAVKDYANQLTIEQETLSKHLNTHNIIITKRFKRIINAVRINVSPKTAQSLRSLLSVKKVEKPRSYSFLTKKSVPAVGAKKAWGKQQTGFDGEGVRVAVIDSGIDYTHAMFGGAGTKDAYLENDPSTN
ncbi:MAG: hypothetical protein ACJZ70_10575 [Limisphaerales bacterium]